MNDRASLRPELPIHAAAVSAASALPVPFVGDMLGAAARGSALRRVLRRHDVRLGPGAREELSSFRVGSAHSAAGALLRRLPGVRAGARVQAGLATYLATRLVGRYLDAHDVGPSLDVAEATRLRLALDACFRHGLGKDALRLIAELGRVSGRSLSAPFRDDLEGRAPHLRAVDTLLDGLADLPAELFEDIERRFDAGLSHEVTL